MNIGEWEAGNHMMRWAIYEDGAWEIFDHMTDYEGTDKTGSKDDYKRAYDLIGLDLTAPVPDGTYRVLYQYISEEGIGKGLIVKNGKFDPETAAAACYEAVCKTFSLDPEEKQHVDHCFVEKFRWNDKRNILEVTLGS